MADSWFDFLNNIGEHDMELGEIAQNMTYLADIQSNDCILDIGTGLGRVAFEAYKKIGENGKVVGLDLENENIEFCKNKKIENNYQNNIDFIQADLTKRLPFPDKSFDIIFSRSVLMHILNKEYTIKELLRVLKDNGRIVLFEVMFYDKLFMFHKFLDPQSTNYQKYKEIEEIVRNDKDDPMTNFDFKLLNKYFKNNGIKHFQEIEEKHFHADFYTSDKNDWHYTFYDKNSVPRKYSLKEKFLKFMTKDEYSRYEEEVKACLKNKFVMEKNIIHYIVLSKKTSIRELFKTTCRLNHLIIKKFLFIKNNELLQNIYLRFLMFGKKFKIHVLNFIINILEKIISIVK